MVYPFPLAHPNGLCDALNNCADTLYTLADLFGFDARPSGYAILANPSARYGLWSQLQGIADLLKVASQIATVDPSRTICEEINLPLCESQYATLKKAAEKSGRTVEDFAETLIHEWAIRVNEATKP